MGKIFRSIVFCLIASGLSSIAIASRLRLYVAVAGEERIAVYRQVGDEGRIAFESDIEVDGGPRALTVSGDGRFLFASLSESGKIASFGIHVTALAPGQFRTEWAGRSMDRTPRCIDDYDDVMNPIRAARQAKSGKQQGDPQKAAQVLLKLIESDNPPSRLFLGEDALELVGKKLAFMQTEMATWDEVSRSTSFSV